jgi:hypothetical protein
MILSVFGLEERRKRQMWGERNESVKRLYSISGSDAIYSHFAHLIHDGLGAFQDVFVYCGTKGQEFLLGIALLMYDLHLLHDRRLAGLARTFLKRKLSETTNELPRNTKNGGEGGEAGGEMEAHRAIVFYTLS